MSLEFDEAKHEYRFKGVLVPSVTKIIAPLFDFSAINEMVLERKSAIGRAVHRACELIDRGEILDPESIDPEVAGYIVGYQKFLRELRPEVEANEERVFHLTHRYAGTLDRIYVIDKVQWWVDIKTSSQLHPGVGVQVSAYQNAYRHTARPGARRGALKLTPDGDYRLQAFEDPLDWQTFLGLLAVYRWKQKHA